jgi:hypothetical protein
MLGDMSYGILPHINHAPPPTLNSVSLQTLCSFLLDETSDNHSYFFHYPDTKNQDLDDHDTHTNTGRITTRLQAVSEIRVLQVGQILKGVQVAESGVHIGILLCRYLRLVSPDEQNPSTKTSGDEDNVETHVDVQGVDVSWSPVGPEELRCNGISASPSHDYQSVSFCYAE